MPELPELEKVRRYLDERIIGKRVSAVTVNRRECINVPPAVYERALVGRQVQHVWRKGKTVVIDMSRDVSLLVHLMLGGDVDVAERPLHSVPRIHRVGSGCCEAQIDGADGLMNGVCNGQPQVRLLQGDVRVPLRALPAA